MRYWNQLIKHDPPRQYGDCLRTCIACILDLEPAAVPHWFSRGDYDNPFTEMERWLNSRGYGSVFISIESLNGIEESAPNIYHIILSDGGHAVIGVNGKIEHDPSWSKIGIDKPIGLIFLCDRIKKI